MLSAMPLTPLHLIGLGILLFILEMILGGAANFDLFLLGSCLIVGGLIGWSLDSIFWALISSSVLALSYVFFMRPFIQKLLLPKEQPSNADALLGQYARVERPITLSEPGQIRLTNGDLWLAKSNTPQTGGIEVQVIKIEGNSLWVTKK